MSSNCTEKIQCLICSGTRHNTLLHGSFPANQVSSPATSSLTVLTGKAPSPSPVQDRLQQLATSSAQEVPVSQQTPSQVDVTVVDHEINSCFRPIFATKVELSNGKATDAYCLYDTGSNRTLITRAFQKRLRLRTKRRSVTLRGLGTSSSGQQDVATLSLRSLVDPDVVTQEIEVFIVESLPVNSSQIARQVHVRQFDYMSDVDIFELPCNQVDILAGTDLAYFFSHFEDRYHDHLSPVAIRNLFGWGIAGPVSHSSSPNLVHVGCVSMEADSVDAASKDPPSQEDGLEDVHGPLPKTPILDVPDSPEDAFRVESPQKPGGGTADDPVVNRKTVSSYVMGNVGYPFKNWSFISSLLLIFMIALVSLGQMADAPFSQNLADAISRGEILGDLNSPVHGGLKFIPRSEAGLPTLPNGDVATVGVSNIQEAIQESSVAPYDVETLLRSKSDFISVK